MAPLAGVLASVAVALGLPSAAGASEFGELFMTPSARAAARLEAGRHEALIADAPDARWEGMGRYGAGDHAGAAEAFSRALDEAGEAADDVERAALLYNRATAETRAGAFEAAIDSFDRALALDPTHADARHNRELAQRLAALQARERQEGGGEGAEPGGEASSASEGGDPGASDADTDADEDADADDADAGADGKESGASDRAPGEPGQPADGGPGDPGADPIADGRDEAAARAAREALAAEAEAARAERSDGSGEAEEGTIAATPTPSEGEQATEQWLRRIPDDPSGLLRRRLERSHREDYPEVRDGAEPW